MLQAPPARELCKHSRTTLHHSNSSHLIFILSHHLVRLLATLSPFGIVFASVDATLPHPKCAVVGMTGSSVLRALGGCMHLFGVLSHDQGTTSNGGRRRHGYGRRKGGRGGTCPRSRPLSCSHVRRRASRHVQPHPPVQCS